MIFYYFENFGDFGVDDFLVFLGDLADVRWIFFFIES